MEKVSFTEIRHMVLDSFYSNLVSKPEEYLDYGKVLGYVSYDFESVFSDSEKFIVDFVLYVLCGGFKSTSYLSKMLKNKLMLTIELENFEALVDDIVKGNDERTDLIINMNLMNLITIERMQTLLNG